MINVPSLFDDIKAKVLKGEKLDSFEILCVTLGTYFVVFKVMYDWFGIRPEMPVNGGSDKDVKDI